jgi:hypothetical protein
MSDSLFGNRLILILLNVCRAVCIRQPVRRKTSELKSRNLIKQFLYIYIYGGVWLGLVKEVHNQAPTTWRDILGRFLGMGMDIYIYGSVRFIRGSRAGKKKVQMSGTQIG